MALEIPCSEAANTGDVSGRGKTFEHAMQCGKAAEGKANLYPIYWEMAR